MELLPLNLISSSFTFRRPLLTDMTWSQSFLRKNLTMILCETITCFNIAWEDHTTNFTKYFEHFRFQVLVGNITRNTCNFQALPSWILGIAQHFLSISISLLLRSVLTFLTILISNSSLRKFSLSLRISSRALVFTVVYCSTLFWSDKVIPVSSFIDGLSSFSQCKLSL